MDSSSFTSKSPGQLVKISSGESAFIPANLPPNWEFPAALWPLLVDAKHQIGILEGLGRTLPNPGILLRPAADREAIRSSSLEGTFATPKELLLFEMEPRESTSERDPTNAHREVFNYQRALQHGIDSTLPISLRLIRDLHRILLTGVRGRDKTPGEFRRIQVAIGSDHRFVPPPLERVPECLDPMEKYIHAEVPAFDPLIDCFLVHYQFETIHPFIDGNGRVGRLLLAIMLQRNCRLSKPWLYLSEYFDDHRDEYVRCLFEVSTNANWHSWVQLCLRATISQAIATISRCDRLRVVREDFLQRVHELGGSVRLIGIVDGIFHSPFIRVASMPKQFSVTYPTAKADIDKLVGIGILKELPGAGSRTFYSPDVFAIAYESLDNSDTPS